MAKATTTPKTSPATGGKIQSATKNVLFGRPITEARQIHTKRKKEDPKAQGLAKVVASITFALTTIFTGITAYQVYLTPNNPGWFTVLWVFGGLAVMTGGYLFGALPRSTASISLMLAVYVVGFLAVPFASQFLITWNFIVGFVAMPFVVAFIMVGKQYVQRVQLYREGYAV